MQPAWKLAFVTLAIAVAVFAIGLLSAALVPVGLTLVLSVALMLLRDRYRDERAIDASRLAQELERLRAQVQMLKHESERTIGTDSQLANADRLANVGRLGASIAHAMGTPLNIISGRALMLQNAQDRGEIDDNARIIIAQTERMATMIRRMLNYSRPHGMGRRRVDVGEALHEAAELFRPLALKNNVAIEVCAPAEPLTVEVVPESLLQVLSNLIMNGIQSMVAGGTLTLEAGRAEQHALPSEPKAPSYACFYVRDVGRGIAQNDRLDIFEPFYSTQAPEDGSGLGLAVSLSIVRQHGGWIDLHSEVGKGSCFKVYLPTVEAACRAAS